MLSISNNSFKYAVADKLAPSFLGLVWSNGVIFICSLTDMIFTWVERQNTAKEVSTIQNEGVAWEGYGNQRGMTIEKIDVRLQ